MERIQNKVIIFEEVRNLDKYMILMYRFRKYKIYYLRINRACENQKWLKEYIQKAVIGQVNVSVNGFFSCFHPHISYANVDMIYEYNFKSSPMINRMVSLFQSTYIESAYKKNLAQKLSRFYGINSALHKLNELFPLQQVIFIPSDGIDWYRTDSCEIYDYFKLYRAARAEKTDLFDTSKVQFPAWAKLHSYYKTIIRKLKLIAKISVFLLWIYIRKINNFLKRQRFLKNNYKYAIMITSPLRQFANKIQKVDFLIDDDFIKRNEVIFISYHRLKNDHSRYFDDNKLDCLDNLGIFTSWKDIGKIIPFYLALLFSFGEEDFILDTSLRLIYYYLLWSGFTKNIAIDNLITHSDCTVHALARNIILERARCKTYYYMDTSNFGCFYNKNNSDIKYTSIDLGFLHYDYLVSWSDKAIEYLKGCKGDFKNYINLGCFWSEHFKKINEGKIDQNLKSRLCEQGYKERMKLLAVFDSNYHEDSVTNYQDGIKFLQDIQRLLNELPDVFIVLKEKKPRNYHQKFTNKFEDIMAIYNELEKHPRCYFTTEQGNSSEIISLSDLTISFPFTSTTFEALSARKKAVWHDATDKFRDTFYDEIPGLVCHDYSGLFDRVKDLLFNISDTRYNAYLDEFVKGKLENYLDGNAITRFRVLLNGMKKGKQK